MIYRKGELSLAMVDRGWPYQVALPAGASNGGAYKAIHAFCKGLSLCPRVIPSSMKANGSTSTVSPSRMTPQNLCGNWAPLANNTQTMPANAVGSAMRSRTDRPRTES
jgi:hypothetical protein